MYEILEKYPDLQIKIDVDAIDVDTMCLMEDFATGANRSIRAMRKALFGLVNYDDEQIGRLPFGDMVRIFSAAMQIITEGALPKAPAPVSGPGPEMKQT